MILTFRSKTDSHQNSKKLISTKESKNTRFEQI